MTEPLVTMQGVVKRFDDFVAVHTLDLEIAAGEFIAIMGPSGCGKTTTLRMLAGLEQPSESDIRIGGQLLNDVPGHERDTPVVWQTTAPIPFPNARQTAQYCPQNPGLDKDQTRHQGVGQGDTRGRGELSGRHVPGP